LKRDDLAPISGVFMTQVEIMQALIRALVGQPNDRIMVDIVRWRGGQLDLTRQVSMKRYLAEMAFHDAASAAYIALQTKAVTMYYNDRELDLSSDSIGPVTAVFRDQVTNTEIAFQTTKADLALAEGNWAYFCAVFMEVPDGSVGDLWLVSQYGEYMLGGGIYVFPPTPDLSDNDDVDDE
jgi:hypothetical protein